MGRYYYCSEGVTKSLTVENARNVENKGVSLCFHRWEDSITAQKASAGTPPEPLSF